MKNIINKFISALFLFLPLSVFAVTVDQAITLVLPSDSSQYTVFTGGAFDSLTVNSSNFDFSMSGGQTIRLRSADKKNLVNNFNTATECKTDYSEVYLTPGAATTNITVTPSGLCTTSSSGGGSPSILGSGGGGSVSVPAPALAPVAVPVPAPAPAPVPVPAPTPPPPAPVQSLAIFSDLVLGSRGNEVTRLQELLAKNKEIYPEGIVSGYFGGLTEAAVRRFQNKYGLPQVGRVGPQTRQKLSVVFGFVSAPVALPAPAVLPAPAPLPGGFIFTQGLSLGMKNQDVTQLQSFLASDKILYPEGVVSGYFGQLTRKAVERFQEKYNIAKAGDAGYGFVGPKTRAKLNELWK